MSYEGYYNYQCRCGLIEDSWDVYTEQPTRCQCGKSWLYEQSVDTTNEKPYIGEWRKYSG